MARAAAIMLPNAFLCVSIVIFSRGWVALGPSVHSNTPINGIQHTPTNSQTSSPLPASFLLFFILLSLLYLPSLTIS